MGVMKFESWMRCIENELTNKGGSCFIGNYENFGEAKEVIQNIAESNKKTILIKTPVEINNAENTYEIHDYYFSHDILIIEEFQTCNETSKNSLKSIIDCYISNGKTVIVFSRNDFDIESIFPGHTSQVVKNQYYVKIN